MSEKCAEIIQMLEDADDLFKKIVTRGEEATKLWDEGITRLAAAIWICEREDESGGEFK